MMSVTADREITLKIIDVGLQKQKASKLNHNQFQENKDSSYTY